MPELSPLNVVWTNQSLVHAAAIKKYLQKEFTQREIDHFYSLLGSFEEAISFFPKLYPETKKKLKIRRAVLSKVLSVFYRIKNNNIEVLAVLDNRCDLSEWL